MTGGYIGQGYKTLSGNDPSLAVYGLTQTETTDYPTRTNLNVEHSDATVRIATDFGSAGERCTMNAIRRYGKPHMDISPKNPPPVGDVVTWLRTNNVNVLNVAGNSEQSSPGIGAFVEGYLRRVLLAASGSLWRVQRVRELMESCGLPAIDVPTPVTAERHDESWAKGVAL